MFCRDVNVNDHILTVMDVKWTLKQRFSWLRCFFSCLLILNITILSLIIHIKRQHNKWNVYMI